LGKETLRVWGEGEMKETLVRDPKGFHR
jgi:hypothetical protein